MKLEFHPFVKDSPMMPLHERDAMADDIEKNGQLLPIMLLGGKIIDGRNRYLACLSRNIVPKTIELTGGDPASLVASTNYFRKHWTREERNHFAAMMSMESPEGRPTKTGSNDLVSQSKAAEIMGVSVSSVKRAKAKITGKTKQSGNGQKDKKANAAPVDSMGVLVPEGAIAYWNRKGEVTDLINQIHAIKRKIEGIPKDDPLYANAGLSGVIGDLNSANNRLRAAVPAHVCPYCKGVKPDNCKACKGRGCISSYFWKTAVPKEMKPEQPF